jgi:hypothetical protein
MIHDFTKYLVIGFAVNNMVVFEFDKFRENINDGWSQPINQQDIDHSSIHMNNSSNWVRLK